jgi:cyclic-di-AMP phosphodiesterase PgpH
VCDTRPGPENTGDSADTPDLVAAGLHAPADPAGEHARGVVAAVARHIRSFRVFGLLPGVRVRLAPVALLVVVAASLVLTVPTLTTGSAVTLAEPAPRTLIAHRDVTVVDGDATERARRLASAAVQPVEVVDRDAQARIVADARHAFAAVRDARTPVPVIADTDDPDAGGPTAAGPDGGLDLLPRFDIPTLDAQVATLQAAGWAADAANLLVSLDDIALAQVESETVQILQQLVRSRLADATLAAQVEATLATEAAVRNLDTAVFGTVVAPLVRRVTVATVAVDAAGTAAARDAAAAAVEPATVTFTSGQILVARGTPVSAVQLAAAAELDLLGASPLRVWLQLIVASGLLVALVGPAVADLPVTRIRSRGRRARLAGALMFLYAAALALVLVARPVEPALVWAVPSAALAVLVASTLGAKAMPAAALTVAALTVATLPGRGELALAAAAVVLAVGHAACRWPARSQLRRLAGSAALVQAGVAMALTATFPPANVSLAPSLLTVALVAAASGVVWVLLAVASLPALEATLGVLTGPGLVELADRNHPLLQRLERDALGTYQHSVLVSQLASAALARVGGDPLLGAVQALYHDVGKVSAPYFFIENQFAIDNPHDSLAPQVSARIIHAHVEDGVELSRVYRLPVEVVDGIVTHHGTSRVEAFYRQALAAGGDVDEAAFRYPGPRPFTLETAVLMLADCCESAVRSAAQADGARLDRAQLAELVEGLVAARVADGQLDDAPVTAAQLAKVTGTFVDVLEGIYHPRIVYPDLPARSTSPSAGPSAETAG